MAFLLEVLSEDGRLLSHLGTEHGIRPGTAYDFRIVSARVLSFRSAVSAQLHCTTANIFRAQHMHVAVLAPTRETVQPLADVRVGPRGCSLCTCILRDP